MQLVIDTLFADTLEFTIPNEEVSKRTFPSIDEEVRWACDFVGIELITYASAMIMRKPDGFAKVWIVSARWIEEQQR